MYEQQIHDSPSYGLQQQSVEQNTFSTSPEQQKQAIKIKQQILESFLILTKKCPTQMQLSQCNKKINQYLSNPIILKILFSLINQHKATNQTLTKLVITQIYSYVKKQISFSYENCHNKFLINKMFMQFFVETTPNTINHPISPSTDYKYKRMMQNAYTKFIFSNHIPYKDERIRQDIVQWIDNNFTQIYSQGELSLKSFQQYAKLSSPITIYVPEDGTVNQRNYQHLISMMHLLVCLLRGGNLESNLINKILPNCFSIYFSVIRYSVKSILSAIRNKEQAEFVQKVSECNLLSQLFLLMYSKMDTGKYPTLRQRVLHTREIYQILLVLLNLSTNFQEFQVVEQIIKLTSSGLSFGSNGLWQSKQQIALELNALVNKLNFQSNFLKISEQQQQISQTNRITFFNLISIKKNSIQIFNKCLKCLTRKKQMITSQLTDKYFYLYTLIGMLWLKIKDCLLKGTQEYLKFIQLRTSVLNKQNENSIQQRSKKENEEKIWAIKKQSQNVFCSSIKFMADVVNLPAYYDIAAQYQNQVIFQLCFPWLISRKQHLQRFQAQDYLFFREDIVNKQNMSYIQNMVASLVEAYLDNIDGAITSVMVNCTSLISFVLTKNEVYAENLPKQLKSSWVLEFYSIERQIQSALTLIAVESYLSLTRNDLTLLLQKWIFTHKNFFLQVNSDYRITVQFLNMYEYYTDNFYCNQIQGFSSSTLEYRPLHQQILKFCCFLMKSNYDYELNKYPNKISQILYYQALDCLSNSFNHTELVPALYLQFPKREEVSVPHYMQPYDNYPFYPIRKSGKTGGDGQAEKEINNLSPSPSNHSNPSSKQMKQQSQQQFGRNGNVSSLYYDINKQNPQRNKTSQLSTYHQMKNVLIHYRKLGHNKDQYINKNQVIDIVQFLADNLATKANIKIIELLIQFLINYLKSEIKNQGSTINIPIVFRHQIATLLSIKIYSMFHSKPVLNKNVKFPNASLFDTKATELIYVLHSISNDPYYIYSLGLEVLWENQAFWNFNPTEDDNNIDRLLKCTDLVVRLALKHFSSEKGININELMDKIAQIFSQRSYQYIRRIKKFNIIFGILLNLILLKVKQQKIFDFLYIFITQKLIKPQIEPQIHGDQQQEQQLKQQSSKKQFSQQQISQLLEQSFYLFLVNMYRNPECLNTEKNFILLEVFIQYLGHYTNANRIITQIGDIFGKILTCCLCIIQKQFISGNLSRFDKNKIQFLWRNILYSGKIYHTQLQKRIISIKLLSLTKQIIRRNDVQFSLQRVENMYQMSCSCIFYSKNKGILMGVQQQQDQGDFDHAGQQQQWQNSPITLSSNQSYIYIQDQVLCLKQTTKQLLNSSIQQIRQWISKVVQSLPVAVRNFVKNKVLHYELQSKQIGLRKIIKVKRPSESMNNITAVDNHTSSSKIQSDGDNGINKKSQIVKKQMAVKNKNSQKISENISINQGIYHSSQQSIQRDDQHYYSGDDDSN